MRDRREPRHAPWRPYRPDTGAAAAEEAGVRRALSEGRLALAPRLDGWAEVRDAGDGRLTEALLLDRSGRPLDVWDTDGLSRWMRGGHAAGGRRASLLGRLRRLLTGKAAPQSVHGRHAGGADPAA